MRHHLDGLSLLLGLLFGAVAVAALNGWLAGLVLDPDLWTPEVAVATASIVLGLVLLAVVAAALSRRRTLDRAATDPADGDPEQTVDDGADRAESDPSEHHVDA